MLFRSNIKPITEANDRMMDFIVGIKEALMEGKPVPGGVAGINHQILIKEILPLTWDLEMIMDVNNKDKLQNIHNFLNAQMQVVRQGDELANFCFAGVAPAPEQLPMEGLIGQLGGQPQGMPPPQQQSPQNQIPQRPMSPQQMEAPF